ncbi:metalloregulator ArsR/SmtB family transcription factor [uncultured Imperialibacter sp.]|uniref:ArsR/SmtB family transcription factor n=1 Tax=uncultured Imperialibacter sp. TaxID=1672639 RepID=UPI0030D95984|tara:strand:+ start:11875 stop:12549 length:675 start_codon:yes stop_codon:yes gene_type:complete
MDKRKFKNNVYGELAKVTKALANPHRMEILDLLAQGPYTVEAIASHSEMTIANTSQHLQVMKGARLVQITRKGNFIYYHLTNERVFTAWRALRELGIHSNAEVEKLMRDYRRGHHSMEPIGTEELLGKLASDDVVLLDVRPEQEYQRGHIHRALSIPMEQLAKRITELSKSKEIIAYCRGPLCVFADEAVELLRGKGFNANRMEEGFPDWAAMGLPIEPTPTEF